MYRKDENKEKSGREWANLKKTKRFVPTEQACRIKLSRGRGGLVNSTLYSDNPSLNPIEVTPRR